MLRLQTTQVKAEKTSFCIEEVSLDQFMANILWLKLKCLSRNPHYHISYYKIVQRWIQLIKFRHYPLCIFCLDNTLWTFLSTVRKYPAVNQFWNTVPSDDLNHSSFIVLFLHIMMLFIYKPWIQIRAQVFSIISFLHIHNLSATGSHSQRLVLHFTSSFLISHK